MLAAAVVGAPAPRYEATETTLTDLFAGERLTFTGELVRDASSAAMVRYAITCCRADASPICVRLAAPPHYAAGSGYASTGRSRAMGASCDCAHSGSRASTRRPIPSSIAKGYASVGLARGSSSSTGMPLGSSTKAIARVPLGDL